jgi:hypothetical protein
MRMVIEAFERPLLIQWERGMNEAEYLRLCAANPDLRIERTTEGTSSAGVQQRAKSREFDGCWIRLAHGNNRR